MLKITVVIAAHNEERHIRHCLDSVFANNYPEFEVIVVDDCSDDKTHSLLLDYRHPRLKILRLNKRNGPAHCRNLGWKMSQAELIFFTDADCAVATDWLIQGAACFDSPEVMAVEGSTSSQGYSNQLRYRNPINPFYPTGESMNCPQRDFAASNIAYRRSALEKSGGFREERYPNGREDTDLGWRVHTFGAIKHCPEMKVLHEEEWWTSRSLFRNAVRYAADVTFFKDHQFFFFRRGKILHPYLFWPLLFPPLIFSFRRLRKLSDWLLLPSLFAYLVALRIHIWRAAWRERILVI